MTEEFVTTAIVAHLKECGWSMLSYDFPQSGTGIPLHPNNRANASKNLGAIIPDIVACDADCILFLENKPAYIEQDVDKLVTIKRGSYSANIAERYPEACHLPIQIGVGFECSDASIGRARQRFPDLDMILCVEPTGFVRVIHG